MSTLRNKVQLIGNVGQEPEIIIMESGRKLAKLSLATNESYVNKDTNEKVNTTYWHNIVAWGNTASNIEKLVKKGHELIIEGKITNRKWTDDSGVKRVITEIVVNSFEDQTYRYTKTQAPSPQEPDNPSKDKSQKNE